MTQVKGILTSFERSFILVISFFSWSKHPNIEDERPEGGYDFEEQEKTGASPFGLTMFYVFC